MNLKELKYRVGTLLGRPRRENFLKILPKRSVGAEIGVFRGEYTRWILTIVRPTKLHLIDGWHTVFGERFPAEWGWFSDFGRLSTREVFESAQRAAKAYGEPGTFEFHAEDDLTCLARFPDGYFDWVYLDTSHLYEHTKRELEILKRKVKSDGIIAGDDWQDDPNHVHHGVCKAVVEFCAVEPWTLAHRDRLGQWAIRRRTA